MSEAVRKVPAMKDYLAESFGQKKTGQTEISKKLMHLKDVFFSRDSLCLICLLNLHMWVFSTQDFSNVSHVCLNA